MTGHDDQREPGENRYSRARDQDEPGAHSGSESQARERTVPGTASAKEGYQTEHGTTAGKPLEGIESRESEAVRPEGADDEREHRERGRDEGPGGA
ncbi:hypothetical protein [Streptomyces cyaneogriseus]|uniref:hypothetical protein n=1 Tax=Streptomyces cyaneogriseus TaxID=68192 RepID=UPI0005C9856A|nr:hypothetical protein [Streptomyces cyaneogriseus]